MEGGRGGGKTDVAGANRLNIFGPRWNGRGGSDVVGQREAESLSTAPTFSALVSSRIITTNRRVCFPIPSNNREYLFACTEDNSRIIRYPIDFLYFVIFIYGYNIRTILDIIRGWKKLKSETRLDEFQL